MTQNRLPWQRSAIDDWFTAFPDGPDHKHRAATVRHMPTATGPNKWEWGVFWEGRFGEHGSARDRQAAADAATEAWHRLVATTEMPRDVQGEIAGMLDRIDREQPPSWLLVEDSDYLRAVLAEIERRWRDLIRLDKLPEPIAGLMDQTSRELYRRRMEGPTNAEDKDRGR